MEKKKFEYLLSSRITVLSDYRNEEYLEKVRNKKSEIEIVWEREQTMRKTKLFNGKILNLATIEEDEHKKELVLRCHPIEYKHYLAERLGIDLGITPLGVSGIVFYFDNSSRMFLLGKRSKNVTQYPEYDEFIPSGSIEINEANSLETFDFTNQLVVELKEELGISADRIKKKNPFCLIFDEIDHVYDIGIEIEVFDSHFKINENEYLSVQSLPLSIVHEHMKVGRIVNTSKKLFAAWSRLNLGDIN